MVIVVGCVRATLLNRSIALLPGRHLTDRQLRLYMKNRQSQTDSRRTILGVTDRLRRDVIARSHKGRDQRLRTLG